MAERTYTWNGNTFPISKAKLTDVEMAGEVRMLMRHQLDHEVICTAARDRIMCLVAEKAALQRALENIKELNMTQPGADGQRWVNSDLIDQEIMAALGQFQNAPEQT